MRSKYLIPKNLIILFIFFSQFSFGQLQNFTLVVTKTNETCTGNGSLSFNVIGNIPGSTILYSVFLLPNTTTAFTTVSNSTLTGLGSGNYRVIATQYFGGLSNSQQYDIVIQNQIIPLAFVLTSIPESCGNGSITVLATQGNPVYYEILTGPVIVAPQTSNVLNNLVAGQYNVRVTDNCGDAIVQTYTLLKVFPVPNFSISDLEKKCVLLDCNSTNFSFFVNANQSATLNYPVTAVFTLFPPNGGTAVITTQIITSGNETFHEFLFTVPLFMNQNFSYNIKITDGCGAVLQGPNNQVLNKMSLKLSRQGPKDCFKKIIVNPCFFLPPYTINFLSAPAGFNPVVFNSSHPGPFFTGTVYNSDILHEIPDGNYVVEITDSCGRTVQNNIDIFNSDTDYIIHPDIVLCNHDRVITIPDAGINVVTGIITSAPVGFNHPIPYDLSSTIVDGVLNVVLQPGMYVIDGINVCGRPYHIPFEIIPSHVPLLSVGAIDASGCFSTTGSIVINYSAIPLINELVAGGPQLSSVFIIGAPTNFNQPLPYDISNTIDNAILFDAGYICTAGVSNLVVGEYTVQVTDVCGNVFIRTVTIGTTTPSYSVNFTTLRGCDEGQGSVFLFTNVVNFQSVTITSAPLNYPIAIPQDVSSGIITNGFYINFIPQGMYTFHTVDFCGVEKNTIVNVPGYHVISNNINIQANCGSFNIDLKHVVNEGFGHEYWLQKLNPITNQWGNPFTGVVYINETIPNNNNSYHLVNMSINYNIVSTGNFRILKYHKVFGNNGIWTNCFQVLKEFPFTGDLKILAANSIPCTNGINQVIVVAEGVAPLKYKITSKNGLPFLVDNGISNVFSGLASGIYNFRVQDQCGNIVNRLFDVSALPEPNISPTNLCNGQNGQLSVQGFSYLNYQWWKGTDTTTILSTTNILNFIPFSNTFTPGTYYVRIYSTSSLSCIDKIISYTVPQSSNPHAGNDNQITICANTNAINLNSFLSGNFDNNGQWEEITNSGMLSGNNWLPVGIAFGTYQFRYTVPGFCADFDEAIITINFLENPPIPIININAQICNDNIIQFNVNDVPNATYSWTGPNGFVSNLQNPNVQNITNQNNGLYNVKINLNGCETTASIQINAITIPEFSLKTSCANGATSVIAIQVNNSYDPNLINYNWTGPNNYSSSSNPIIISKINDGNYTLTITTEAGCSTSKNVNVTNDCLIPNIITPNGDGDIDYFDLTGYNVSKIEIYSRWGRLVYDKENYINEWHGQNNNDGFLPDGTYFYIFNIINGGSRTGWVYLVK